MSAEKFDAIEKEISECKIGVYKDIQILKDNYILVMGQLKKMDKSSRKKDKYMIKHMEGEDLHHAFVAKSLEASNTALLEMGEQVKTLMQDKKDRDDVKDKRDGIKEKVYASVAIAVLFGSYNLFMDLMAMKSAMGVE